MVYAAIHGYPYSRMVRAPDLKRPQDIVSLTVFWTVCMPNSISKTSRRFFSHLFYLYEFSIAITGLYLQKIGTHNAEKSGLISTFAYMILTILLMFFFG